MTNVATDAATDGGPFTSASSKTYAHTVGSLTNGVLYVGVDFYTNGTTVTIGASGVTYNGTTMTRVAQSARSPDDDRAEIWRLLAPASGTHNVVITFSGGATDGETGAVSLQFVDQTTPERAGSVTTAVSATSASTTATISVPNAQAGDASIDAVTWDLAGTAGTMVSHSPRTQRWNSATVGNEGGAGSSMLGPANPQTLDWTFGAGRAWAMAGLIAANDGGGGGGFTTIARRMLAPVSRVGERRPMGWGFWRLAAA